MICLLGGVWVICCGWVVGFLEVGMAMGRGGSEGWGLRPNPQDFVFPHSRMTGKIFLPHPYLLGPHKAPSYPVKLHFLLIYPTTSTNFLMKPISLIKLYLKLQLNLSYQIKLIFRKN